MHVRDKPKMLYSASNFQNRKSSRIELCKMHPVHAGAAAACSQIICLNLIIYTINGKVGGGGGGGGGGTIGHIYWIT